MVDPLDRQKTQRHAVHLIEEENIEDAPSVIKQRLEALIKKEIDEA